MRLDPTVSLWMEFLLDKTARLHLQRQAVPAGAAVDMPVVRAVR
jgi:hypothetical protein